MARSTNDVQVFNAALMEIGITPVATFSGASPQQKYATANYENIVLEALSTGRWGFAKGVKQLSRLADAPIVRWDAAYTIPPEAIAIQSVMADEVLIKFDRFGDEIHCDASVDQTVTMIFTQRVPEADWPPRFTSLVVAMLAAGAAMGVKRDRQLSLAWKDEARSRAVLAASADAQERSPSRIDVSQFLSRRATIGRRA